MIYWEIYPGRFFSYKIRYKKETDERAFVSPNKRLCFSIDKKLIDESVMKQIVGSVEENHKQTRAR